MKGKDGEDRTRDLRGCATAWDCRDRLPELAAWMPEEDLKLLPIWRGWRFENGQMYFDLDNPERGPFLAHGDEALPHDHTYVCRADVPDHVWNKLITWRQPVSATQGEALETQSQITRPRPPGGSVPLP